MAKEQMKLDTYAHPILSVNNMHSISGCTPQALYLETKQKQNFDVGPWGALPFWNNTSFSQNIGNHSNDVTGFFLYTYPTFYIVKKYSLFLVNYVSSFSVSTTTPSSLHVIPIKWQIGLFPS